MSRNALSVQQVSKAVNMVEVFKTNIRTRAQAQAIKNSLQDVFEDYQINFDLEDCDRIMRIRSRCGPVDNERVCRIVLAVGFEASVLSDDPAIAYAFESEH
jgi:hypothetical protein